MPLSISALCRNITPSTTLRLNALANDMRAAGRDVIALAAGEPDFDTPENIRQAAHAAIDSGKSKYTAVSGILPLRRAIADHLQKNKGLSYGPEEIIVATGAKQVLMGALLAILEAGDEVIIPAPCWLSYPEMIRMAGGVPVAVHTGREQGYMPTPQQLRQALTPRTRAILFNTPNNPTGAVWDEALLQQIAAIAREHDLYLISDEIYEDLVYEGRHVAIAGLDADAAARTITVSGFSKSYAMTGWRLGYASGPRPVIDAMDAYQSHATGNTCSIAQYAGLEALQGDQQSVRAMQQAFARRRSLILEKLSAIPGITFGSPNGAFYVLADITALLGKAVNGRVISDDGVFAEVLLEDALVSVIPGGPFYAPGCLRLSYATSEQKITAAVERLGHFVQKLV